jgi:hypothetical protein
MSPYASNSQAAPRFLPVRIGLDCFGGNDISAAKWVKPQFTRLVEDAPAGGGWLHEIKYDGHRTHVRIDGGDIKLLTRTGLDWSHR